MFRFPAFASAFSSYRNRFRWVAPFGHLWVYEYLPLATAFRSLSRPSSPPRAKASSVRPSFHCISWGYSLFLDILSFCHFVNLIFDEL